MSNPGNVAGELRPARDERGAGRRPALDPAVPGSRSQVLRPRPESPGFPEGVILYRQDVQSAKCLRLLLKFRRAPGREVQPRRPEGRPLRPERSLGFPPDGRGLQIATAERGGGLSIRHFRPEAKRSPPACAKLEPTPAPAATP